ncbi:MAG: hypothetical protein KKH04_06685 [Proteobacteria bacterium]|nr:hypothetical protein [Pseudomonadota bacterium]
MGTSVGVAVAVGVGVLEGFGVLVGVGVGEKDEVTRREGEPPSGIAQAARLALSAVEASKARTKIRKRRMGFFLSQ